MTMTLQACSTGWTGKSSNWPPIWLRKWLRVNLSDSELLRLRHEWLFHARGAQYRPGIVGDNWLVIGGRGSGKTRLGAQWVDALVHGLAPFADHSSRLLRIALVGETLGDVREVMIEGASGIGSVPRAGRPRYEVTRRRLLWPNGATAQAISSEDPESLRGPQFEAAWCDELGKWKHAEACFDMLQFGLRLGARPRQLITTTPRPTTLMRRLAADPSFTVTRMRTSDNAGNLAAGFMSAMQARYGNTRLGRQELDGELIEDRQDALWTRAMVEQALGDHGPLCRVVVALDPPASARRTSDACGIVVAGRDETGRAVVLEDATLVMARPRDWAMKAVALYHRHQADAVVAEVNQGGDMVGAVLRTVDQTIPIREVRASRGKWLRAEPVAALYAQGRVVHAARMPELEDEMCNFGTDGLAGGRSPDRLDAMVWAITDLLLASRGEPQLRAI